MFGNNRKVEGLFTLKDLEGYCNPPVLSNRILRNFMLVNEINEKTQKFIGKDAKFLENNLDSIDEVIIDPLYFKKIGESSIISLVLAELFFVKLRIKGNFSNLNFAFSSFYDSFFIGCDFSESNFSNSSFKETDFSNTNFLKCNFSNVSFIGCDFSDARFLNTEFKDVIPIIRNKIVYSEKIYPFQGNIYGACESMEGFNIKALKDNDFKLIEVEEKGLKIPLGIVKFEEAETFLSFQTVINSKGKIILIKGFQYGLIRDQRNLILNQEPIIINVDRIDLSTKRINQGKDINYEQVIREINKCIVKYNNGDFSN